MYTNVDKMYINVFKIDIYICVILLFFGLVWHKCIWLYINDYTKRVRKGQEKDKIRIG